MSKSFVFIAVILLTALTISCKDKTDTTVPGATVQSPSNGDEYAIGESIMLVAEFTDNKELKSCKASISYSGDGSGEGSPWAPLPTVISLSGSSQSVDRALFGGTIPVCKTGDYTITLEISDAAGTPNVKTIQIDVKIISNAPVLTVEKPAEGQSYVAGIGDIMTLTATCTDNKQLKELVCNVDYMDNPKNVLKGSTGVNDPWEPVEFKIPLSGTSKTFTNEPLFEDIPESIAGNYKLVLTLYDTEGNSTQKEINFILTN